MRKGLAAVLAAAVLSGAGAATAAAARVRLDTAAGAAAAPLGCAGDTAYGELVVVRSADVVAPRVALRGSLEHVLRQCLAVWAQDGSVVLQRGTSPTDAARLTSESVTLDRRD